MRYTTKFQYGSSVVQAVSTREYLQDSNDFRVGHNRRATEGILYHPGSSTFRLVVPRQLDSAKKQNVEFQRVGRVTQVTKSYVTPRCPTVMVQVQIGRNRFTFTDGSKITFFRRTKAGAGHGQVVAGANREGGVFNTLDENSRMKMTEELQELLTKGKDVTVYAYVAGNSENTRTCIIEYQN